MRQTLETWGVEEHDELDLLLGGALAVAAVQVLHYCVLLPHLRRDEGLPDTMKSLKINREFANSLSVERLKISRESRVALE
jgi:hypothetical protein